MMKRNALLLTIVCLCADSIPALAAVSVSLSPSVGQPRPVGTAITWNAAASGVTSGQTPWFRFTVSENGATPAIVKDFSPESSFTWVPAKQEGSYQVGVTARDPSTLQTATTSQMYAITSRVTSGPAVSGTGHPLVALYSAPPCPSGSQFRVRYKLASDVSYKATPLVPCSGSTSMNEYVAGLYANSTYTMVSDVLAGPSIASSPAVSFTTGSIGISVPSDSAAVPPQQPGSLAQGVVLYGPLNVQATAFATDLAGKVIWYYSHSASTLARPVHGGGIMTYTITPDAARNTLTEIDPAGNTVIQTNASRVSEELPRFGITSGINTFHHDAWKLPNGGYLALAATERILNNVQGSGNVDVIGDVILELDSNMQVVWVWDSFAHLDTHRTAILNETCPAGLQAGCPPVYKATRANDWLHGNSISIAPDGNIIYSARHQDFVYKIDYRNGAGDGHVIWRLGKDGDFSTNSSDPYPWQSHQHDPEFDAGASTMTLYDNGNTRHALQGGNSRGQVLSVNETNRTVTYLLNADLGVFSSAVGSAQKLTDGNYHFESGFLVPSQAVELSPSGAVVYKATGNSFDYRSFRMKSLYGF